MYFFGCAIMSKSPQVLRFAQDDNALGGMEEATLSNMEKATLSNNDHWAKFAIADEIWTPQPVGCQAGRKCPPHTLRGFLLGFLLHLRHELPGALFNFLLRQVSLVGTQVPGMAEGIDERSVAVSPKHVGYR
jgi:hypothetical protein